MAKKEKKITIKHYLNKKLKPLIHNGKNYYPVYLRLGYDRITTIVKSNYLVYSDDIFSKDIVENEKDHLHKIDYVTEESFSKPEFQSLFKQETEGLKIAMGRIIEKGENPVKTFDPAFFSFISQPLHIEMGNYLKDKISEEIRLSDVLLDKLIHYRPLSITELKKVVDNYFTKEVRSKKIFTSPIVEQYFNIGLELESRKDLKMFHVFTSSIESLKLSQKENNTFMKVTTDKIFKHVRNE